MSRIARVILEGIPYHITQRGNARQQIFFDNQDYALYLDLIRLYSDESSLRILAYCLMPNHVHLIAIPGRPGSMASALGRTHANYARHFNLKKRACGHVWQSRYFSTPLDADHLWHAMAYVERNPVRAGLVEYAEQYLCSSARARLGLEGGGSTVDLTGWNQQYTKHRWKQILETSIAEEAFGQRLQESSRRGRPFGSEDFARELERRCGRTLRALPVGRPKKREGDRNTQLSIGFGV